MDYTEAQSSCGGKTEVEKPENECAWQEEYHGNVSEPGATSCEIKTIENPAFCIKDPYDVLLHVSKDTFTNALNLKTNQSALPHKRTQKDAIHIQEIMSKSAQNAEEPRENEEVLYWRLLCGDKLISYCSPEEQTLSHGGQPIWICSVCGDALRTQTELNAHRTQHTPRREHICSICGAAFARSDTLRAHSRVHTGERPFLCEVCGATFTQAANLRQHARVHSGERPYRCGACAASFTQLCNLKKHERIHSGERPFACDACSATFAQAGALKRHARKHSGERPYACEFCSEAFAVSSHLKIHRRTHTGERPYRCDHCGMAFIQNSGLISHRKRAHGVFPEKRRCKTADTDAATSAPPSVDATTVPAPSNIAPGAPDGSSGDSPLKEDLPAITSNVSEPNVPSAPAEAWPPAAAPITLRCCTSTNPNAEPVTYTFRVVETANVSDVTEVHPYFGEPSFYKMCTDVPGISDVALNQIPASGIFQRMVVDGSATQTPISNV